VGLACTHTNFLSLPLSQALNPAPCCCSHPTPQVWNWLGLARVSMGDICDGVEAYKKALELVPDMHHLSMCLRSFMWAVHTDLLPVSSPGICPHTPLTPPPGVELAGPGACVYGRHP
jgi:hypothetical protein